MVESKESEVRDKTVQYIIKSLNDEVDVVRCSAAKAIGKMAVSDAVEPLIERLDDDDPDVRYDSAWALGQLGDKRAVKPLIKLIDDDDPTVVECAIESISKMKGNGTEDAIEPLIERLKLEKEYYYEDLDDNAESNINAEIQEKAALALGEVGDSKAVKALLEVVDDYSIFDTIQASFISLLKIGDKKGIERVEKAFTDPDPLIRRRVLRAMVKAEYSGLMEKLSEALIDEDSEVKLISMEVLAKMTCDGKAPVPLVLLLQDKNRDVRLKAANTVGEIMGEKAISHLIPMLGENDAVARACVVEILGNIRSEDAVDPLIVLLQDEKEEKVVEEAISSLGKIGGDEAFKFLLDLLRDKERSKGGFLKNRLIYAIGCIKSSDALSALVDVFKDKSELELNKKISAERVQGFKKEEELVRLLNEAIEEEEREAAERASEEEAEETEGGVKVSQEGVKETGEESSDVVEGDEGEATGEEVEDKEVKREEVVPGLKVWAARAMKGSSSKVSEEFLLHLIEDDEPLVRKEAAISLAYTGNEAALDILLDEMPVEEGAIEVEILESIAKLGGKRVDDILLGLLKNNDPVKRYYTLQAISSRENNEEIFSRVVELLKDENEIVQKEAVVFLGKTKDEEAVEPLISVLFSTEAGDYLNDDIINALSSIDSKGASDMILYGLSDCKEWSIQSHAIEVLTELNLNA